MTIEIFKITIPGRSFIFVSARTNERAEYLCSKLVDLGASAIGSQAFMHSAEATPEEIRDVVGDLKDGECIHLVRAVAGILESHLLVPPRVDRGIRVQ